MTVHDQHTEFDPSSESAELATEPVIDTHDHSTGRSDVDGGGLHQADFQSTEPVQPVSATEPVQPASAAPAETSTDQALFADHEHSDLQSRWAEVQAAFVDDPKASVQQADGLVNDVVEKITSSFAQARSQLEEQWSRGEDASTEDLRVALTRYREFFQRLLTV
jgi:hypothetical protein